MSYVKERLTDERCLLIQQDLVNLPARGNQELWDLCAVKSGPYEMNPSDYQTPRGLLSTDDPWVYDRNNNFYLVRVTYVLEILSFVLFLDGKLYPIESKPKSRTMVSLELEDNEELEMVKKEFYRAMDVLMLSGYRFEDDE